MGPRRTCVVPVEDPGRGQSGQSLFLLLAISDPHTLTERALHEQIKPTIRIAGPDA